MSLLGVHGRWKRIGKERRGERGAVATIAITSEVLYWNRSSDISDGSNNSKNNCSSSSSSSSKCPSNGASRSVVAEAIVGKTAAAVTEDLKSRSCINNSRLGVGRNEEK